MLLDLIFSIPNSSNPALLITEIVMILGIVLLSLSAHEAAHAFAAKKLGDHTAANEGRITLNPMKHLHPLGFLSMALIGIGWANPVPINARNFRDPRKGMMLSALAGPLSNFCIASLSTFLAVTTNFAMQTSFMKGHLTESNFYIFQALYMFFYYAAFLNFSLSVFNLIPCPPFDGSRIFFYFLPKSWYFKVMQYERYLGLGILLLFIALNRMNLSPVSFLADGLYDLVAKPFSLMFSSILNTMA